MSRIRTECVRKFRVVGFIRTVIVRGHKVFDSTIELCRLFGFVRVGSREHVTSVVWTVRCYLFSTSSFVVV